MAVAAETRPGAGNGESQERQPVSATKLWVRDERTGNIILPELLENLVGKARMLFEPQYRTALITQKVAVTIGDARGLKTDPESYLAQGPSGNSPRQLDLNIQFLTPNPALQGIGSRRNVSIPKMISRGYPGFETPDYESSGLVVWSKPTGMFPFDSPLAYTAKQFYLYSLSIHNISHLRKDQQSALNSPLEATGKKTIYVNILLADVYRNNLDRAQGLNAVLDRLEKFIKIFEQRYNIPPQPVKQPEPPKYDDYRRGEY